MNPRILIVEDDQPLRSALSSTLRAQSFEIVEAATVEEAVTLFNVSGADLIVLDLNLPGSDGLDVLRRVRTFSEVPIVVLTVRADKSDKLAALDGGADDYVTKPFDSDELVARLRAALRRRPTAAADDPTITYGGLRIDRARGVVIRDGEEVKLTPTEWRFVELLVGSDGRLLTYSTIGRELQGRNGELDARSLRVLVAQLRRKLGDDASDPKLILTHFGLGLRWIAGTDGTEAGLV